MTDDPSHADSSVSPRVAGWITRHAPRGEVLVAGCADPAVVLALARAGARVTGIDAAEEALERVRAIAAEGGLSLRLQCVEAAEWPFERMSFDAVVLDRLLEHELRAERSIAEARRVIRERGSLIICSRYGLHPHDDHADALYLGRLAALLDASFTLDAIDLVDGFVVAAARPGQGSADAAVLLGIAERRLAEMDGSAYELAREAEAERTRADRLEATVRMMRASRGWQIARALREGSRSPAKLPRLLSQAIRRKA